MIPTLAVVGHPNKGKSSIVATLSENTRVEIGPIPGTTRHADHFKLKVNGEPLYDLVDTPGFQRAGQLHNWLIDAETSASGDASMRAELVRKFVATHAHDDKFADECALLQPIIDGAGILYVVDGSKPYGAEYELEMEVLRWTGQPRMALINMIGEQDFREEWRRGLGQYFSIVREFNAHHASFDQRISLLQAFAEIEESWRGPMTKARNVLKGERKRQRDRSSDAIANMLNSALAASVEQHVHDVNNDNSKLQQLLSERLLTNIRRTEARTQSQVQRIYHHSETAFSTDEFELLNSDLFAQQSWELFGLSKLQLIATGAVSGAVMGGTLDLLVGGTSLFMGSLIGSMIGSISAWFGGPEIAKIKILGTPLGGNIARAGPIQNPNLAWVLLGRACLHHTLFSEHNHAARTRLVGQVESSENFFDFLDTATRNRMERFFTRIRKSESVDLQELSQTIEQVLLAHSDQ